MSNKPERRRRFIRATAPAFGLLAAGLLVWQGSYAAFSATTNNTGSTWASGSLNLVNDGNGGGTFLATQAVNWGQANIKPGATATVCINVQNTGTAAGTLNFYRSGALADTNVGNPASLLSGKILLTIDAVASATKLAPASCTPAGFSALGASTPVASAVALSALPTAWSGGATAVTVPAGQFAVYRVMWLFDPTAGNTYQTASTGTAFTWEEQ